MESCKGQSQIQITDTLGTENMRKKCYYVIQA